MKTIVIILATLLISQWCYANLGPRNPIARITNATSSTLHSVLNAAQKMVP